MPLHLQAQSHLLILTLELQHLREARRLHLGQGPRREAVDSVQDQRMGLESFPSLNVGKSSLYGFVEMQYYHLYSTITFLLHHALSSIN